MRRLGIVMVGVLAVVVTIGALPATAARVATLESDADLTYPDARYVLEYTSNDSAPNDITATDSPEKFTLTDPEVTIVARTLDQRNPCSGGTGSAECAYADSIVIESHGGSDRINVSGPDLKHVHVTAGRGNDNITVNAPLATVFLECGPGRDRVTIVAARDAYGKCEIWS